MVILLKGHKITSVAQKRFFLLVPSLFFIFLVVIAKIVWKLWRGFRGHPRLGGSTSHLQSKGCRCLKRQEGNHEDRRGREITSNIWAQTTSGSLDSKMSSPLPVRQTRSTRTRCHCSSWEKVAGGGARKMLEEGREGSHSRLCPGMEILPVWIWQTGLIVQKCFSAIIYSIINVQYSI